LPGYLLHSGATVLCAHGGQAAPSTPSPRVKVGGQAITTQAAPYTISGCAFTPPTGNGPCATAQWTVAAQRVKSGGQPVLLQDSQASCVPTGTPLNIVVTQVRVKGT
jgi:hypothetical protein